MEVPNPTSPLNNLRLDVRIVSAPELTVQTTLAKLSGDADLRLRGTAMRPVLLGRINIAEGDINLNGTKYHLDRGDITFANPVRIDPVLDMEATTRVRDYDITIGLHGTMEKLTTTYRSDPPLSSDDIIALLAFGRTQEEELRSERPRVTAAWARARAAWCSGRSSTRRSAIGFRSCLASARSASIRRWAGPDNNPSARLTIEQQVSNNVTLTYITNLTQSAQQVIQFEYNINTEYTVQGDSRREWRGELRLADPEAEEVAPTVQHFRRCFNEWMSRDDESGGTGRTACPHGGGAIAPAGHSR